MGGLKRAADLPVDALDLGAIVSKADLLEVAYDLASLCNDGDGCDDEESTIAKLVEMLNARRSARGVKALVFKPLAKMTAGAAEAVLVERGWALTPNGWSHPKHGLLDLRYAAAREGIRVVEVA